MKTSGGKYTSSHTSAIEASLPLLKIAEKHPAVGKISLGFIRSARGTSAGVRSLKITVEPACLKLTVRGGSSIQEIRVYTSDPTDVTQKLQVEFKRIWPDANI